MAMDYCEESLQEIDVTTFLNTLCGHMRVFREHCDAPRWAGGNSKPSMHPATLSIEEGGDDRSEDCAAKASSSM